MGSVVAVTTFSEIKKKKYPSQHLFLSSFICNKFNITLRTFLKQSIHCPKNLYSSILHGPIYPNIVNIFNNQLKAQASLIIAQANLAHTSLSNS